MRTVNEDNSKSELKNVILDLFDQVRQANARNAEKDRANMEKDRINASLSENLDAVLENQKQQMLNLESWLAKERKWNKERSRTYSLSIEISEINPGSYLLLSRYFRNFALGFTRLKL